MVKRAKMELLRALVRECLSAAAEEIFKIVERTILDYEEEMSCSKWVVDSHRRLLDVAKSHSEDALLMRVTDEQLQCGLQQPPASVNVTVCWDEPHNTTTTRPTELTDHPNVNSLRLDSSPASDDDRSDQETLTDSEEDDVKLECDLNTSAKIVKAKKPSKCPVCLSGFSSKKMMVRHIKKHPEDKSSSYQCQFCDRYFARKSEFIIHTRTHKAAKPYKCQDKSFDHRDSVFIHRQHTEDKPHVCFSEKLGAETLLRSVTPASKMESELDLRQEETAIKTFPLAVSRYDKSEFDQESLQPLCLYQIQTVTDIDKDSAAHSVDHIKTEAGADEQQLLTVNPGDSGDGQPKHLEIRNIVPKRPPGKSTELIVQFEAGTAQKPYKCPCCTKCFSLTKTLIRHVKMHTEEKPYPCQFCGRNFCQKSDLVNHTRIHTGERPYRCHICHKSFAQKGNLVVHMRRHTGEKSYQCQESSSDSHMQSSVLGSEPSNRHLDSQFSKQTAHQFVDGLL